MVCICWLDAYSCAAAGRKLTLDRGLGREKCRKEKRAGIASCPFPSGFRIKEKLLQLRRYSRAWRAGLLTCTTDRKAGKPDPLGRSPAFSSAPFRPPKCLYSASSEMRSRRRSRRLGLCLRFLAHERMAWRISTRDMALSPGRGFQEKIGHCLLTKLREFLGYLRAAGAFRTGIPKSDNSTLALLSAKLLIAKGQLPNSKYRLRAKLQSQYSKYRTNKASEKCADHGGHRTLPRNTHVSVD